MRNPSLHERAAGLGVWLAIIGAGSACDDNRHFDAITTAPPVSVVVTISPSLLGLTSLGGFNGPACSGATFAISFNLVVASTNTNLTLNQVTLHLLDGTTLGGPSVTIPGQELTAMFGSTLVPAGATQTFPLQPVFICAVARPQAMTATVLVTDQRGAQQAMGATATIH